MEKNKISGFHTFIIVIASALFVYSLGKIILFAFGRGSELYLISTSTSVFDWLNAITGAVAAIVLFTSEIKHIKNKSWYNLFLAAIIIFILNNLTTLTDSIMTIIQARTDYFNAFSISQDIFAIGFWIFSAWFTKKDIDAKK